MGKSRYKSILSNEIEARLCSDDWNLKIAGCIIRRRKRRARILTAAAGAATSLAAGAVFIFAFLPGIQDRAREGEILNNFINAQVEGTWKNVFAGNGAINSNESLFVETQYDDAMDNLIDDTLVQRF